MIGYGILSIPQCTCSLTLCICILQDKVSEKSEKYGVQERSTNGSNDSSGCILTENPDIICCADNVGDIHSFKCEETSSSLCCSFNSV